MNALARIEGPQLSEKQRALVDALLAGKPEDEAFEAAAYSDRASAKRALASEAVQTAIRKGCKVELGGRLQLKALRTLDKLMNDDAPAATRFNAAKLTLELAQADDAGPEGELAKMSIGELEALARRLAADIEGNARDITPQSGAQ